MGADGTAYYEPGSFDKSRKGIFYVNVNDPKAFLKMETMAVTLHEGNPGHHLQVVVSAQAKDAPLFISNQLYLHWGMPSGPGGYVSFIEGWALYAEFLGNEMSLYDQDNQIFGYCSWNLLRASFLVVDTGLHSLGWSRDKAADFLYDNTFASRATSESLVDRFIAIPGQALAYKMGQRAISSVREKMKQRQDFDIKRFHDAVLNCVGPLDYLEDCVSEELEMDISEF